MKIGIITFHRAENFGAVLQCYALQEFLKSQGHDVEIVDYRPDSIEKGYKYFNVKYTGFIKFIKDIILNILPIFIKMKKKAKYRKFRDQHFNLSRPAFDSSQIDDKYDALICGSDQVWNLRLTEGIDSVYFLDIPTNAKKIAFSCSSENKDYPRFDEEKVKLEKMLSSFSYISVRENSLAEYLHYHLHIDSVVTCDPTFLQKREFYMRLLSNPLFENNSYVLVYNLVETEKSIVFAKQYAKQENLKVIVIHAGFRSKFHGDIDIYDAGPVELLNYINNAKVIITTSFHGLALSLIMNKQVCVIDDGPNIRQKNLLKHLGLESIIVSENFNFPYIDYKKINKEIQNYKEDSMEYLKMALDNE